MLHRIQTGTLIQSENTSTGPKAITGVRHWKRIFSSGTSINVASPAITIQREPVNCVGKFSQRCLTGSGREAPPHLRRPGHHATPEHKGGVARGAPGAHGKGALLLGEGGGRRTAREIDPGARPARGGGVVRPEGRGVAPRRPPGAGPGA